MDAAHPVNQLYYVQRDSYGSKPTKGSVSFGDDGIVFGPEMPITFKTDITISYITLPSVQNHRYFRITITENDYTRDQPLVAGPTTALAEVGTGLDPRLDATLIAFTAHGTNAGVELNWTTSREAGTGTYVVQRSPDGLNNFTTVGLTVSAVGTNSATSYSFTDISPVTGSSFYRLQLTGLVPVVATQTSRLIYAEFPFVNYSEHQPKNANIFYFIPSDLAAPDDFKHRMDDILIGIQTYFKTEMARYGYNKTMGLVTDATKTKVNLIVINAKFPKSAYGENNSNAIMDEVNIYKEAHPSPYYGDHNLIMLPAYSIDYNTAPNGNDPDGIFLQGPFFGSGKDCFAMDYDQMKQSNLALDKQNTRDGRNSVKYIGGMAHELAHGLNVPHNQRKVSEESALGTLLMNTGNYTYGAYKTSLSATDAAILNRNQVFNDASITYYGPKKATLTAVSACYNDTKKSIIITGTVAPESGGASVTDIGIYNDPDKGTSEGMGDNKDYDAVTWATTVTGANTFYIEEPIDELQVKSNSQYEMKIKLIQLDGNTTDFKYRYDFGASIPVISYNVYAPVDGQTGITLTPVSFSIQASASANGTISPSGAVAVSCVDDQTFTITPNAGFVIDKLTIDGEVRIVSGGQVLRTSSTQPVSFTFSSVNTTHTITSTFKTDPLPVTLVAFNVELKQKNTASLTWKTTQETNNSGFDIEMSNDAHKFIKVGSVEGKGDSKVLNTYAYTVTDLSAGNYYFRLKQLDFDGKFEYSTIRALTILGLDNIAFLYPNPSNGKLKLNAGTHQNEAFTIRILNESGKEVLSLPASTEYAKGMEINVSSLPSGLYNVTIHGAAFVENLKFVKL